MTTKPRAIVFDSDEILLDWVTAFVTWHNKHHGTNVDASAEYHDKLHNLFEGIPYEIMDQRMQDFNSTAYEFGLAKPVQGAKLALSCIERYNDLIDDPSKTIDLFVITKSGASESSARMRRANLAVVFGDVFKHVYCLDLHESKVPYMKEIQQTHNVLLFVDDYFKNCEQIVTECGVRSIALNCMHNRHLSAPTIHELADTWENIYDVIYEVM